MCWCCAVLCCAVPLLCCSCACMLLHCAARVMQMPTRSHACTPQCSPSSNQPLTASSRQPAAPWPQPRQQQALRGRRRRRRGRARMWHLAWSCAGCQSCCWLQVGGGCYMRSSSCGVGCWGGALTACMLVSPAVPIRLQPNIAQQQLKPACSCHNRMCGPQQLSAVTPVLLQRSWPPATSRAWTSSCSSKATAAGGAGAAAGATS